MIFVTGSVQMNADTRDEAIAIGCAHSQRSRQEPGCIAHHCMIDAEDPNRLVFHEEWVDLAALQTHFAVPESGAFVRQISALASSPPEMRIFTVEETRQLPI